jgi:hypothetical protein
VSSLELIAAIGAFVSAIASAVAAWLAVKMMRADCDKRVEAFREGVEMGRER